MARRYSVRPSDLIGIEDELLAFELDLGVAMRGYHEDAKARKSKSGGGGVVTAEELYANHQAAGGAG